MKDLIKAAKEKGFKVNSNGDHVQGNFWIEKDYLWMCLLSKWLRDEHLVMISILFDDHTSDFEWNIHKEGIFLGENRPFETYEQALQEALIKAITLI